MAEKKMPRVMIAALKSGSGKTLFTCMLLEALKQRGLNPAAFKCGPDYIDPMFHKKVIGVPSYNLDAFFSESRDLKSSFAENSGGAGIAVLEGVMGVFDGLGGIKEEGSSYQIAGILGVPIVLVIDVHGMGRTVLSVLAGVLRYDAKKLIRGIILNRTTRSFYETLKPVIEEELSIAVLGYYPVRKNLCLESRHLGLKMPDEVRNIKEQMRQAAAELEASVDVEAVAALAADAAAVSYAPWQRTNTAPAVKIAVAMDEAFCFYYEDNLRLLKEAGAQTVFFSPLRDTALPKDVDGLLLGGGYPELYAKELAGNEAMKKAVREAIENGMPSVAECGGFLYLHEELEDAQGNPHAMCGVVRGRCYNTGKPVRFGYITVEETGEKVWGKGGELRGHEFHYYDSTVNGEDCIARKPVGKKEWACVHEKDNCWWGFPHLYYPSCPGFAVHFIQKAMEFHQRRTGSEGKK
ncbi:MAG: cobyrinate a,c-diamide synthase [Lachnospiraceae bacterium]|nr:cobyrinate a,c-diamide synthase [Lachnospiraceae bacterium]